MILLTIRMKVLPEKRMELSQAITSLIASIRTEKGCQRCDFCQDIEDENEFCILGEWDTQENLNSHLKSERFKILRGAMSLLQAPCEIVFHTVAAGNEENAGAVPAGGVMTGMTGADEPSVKPNSNRRNTMKSSTKDQAEGTFHKVKGKIKEIAGKVSLNAELGDEGKDEKRAGKIQQKVGDIEKVVGK